MHPNCVLSVPEIGNGDISEETYGSLLVASRTLDSISV